MADNLFLNLSCFFHFTLYMNYYMNLNASGSKYLHIYLLFLLID